MLVSFCGAAENGKISFLGRFGLVLVLEWFWVGGYGVWECFANIPLATRKNVPDVLDHPFGSCWKMEFLRADESVEMMFWV